MEVIVEASTRKVTRSTRENPGKCQTVDLCANGVGTALSWSQQPRQSSRTRPMHPVISRQAACCDKKLLRLSSRTPVTWLSSQVTLQQSAATDVRDRSSCITNSKDCKDLGHGGLCPEVLKLEELTMVLRRFQKFWDIKQQEIGKKGVVSLPKKGDLGDCNRWRGIPLFSQIRKVFRRVILKRSTSTLDNTIKHNISTQHSQTQEFVRAPHVHGSCVYCLGFVSPRLHYF